MPSIIFAQPRHQYGSYADYRKLIELSGFPLVFMDEIDPDSDNIYIFSTPATHWHTGVERKGWPGARARIIYWSLEWYKDVDYRSIPGVEIWSPDAWYADLIGARYVPMGGHPDLKLHPTRPNGRVFDVATLFAPTPRRQWAVHQLQNERHLHLAPTQDCWDEHRHNVLMQSRCMVMVHQLDNSPTVAPQRWALAAAYGLPVITETLGNPGIFSEGRRLMADLPFLGEFTAMWLRAENKARLEDYGNALHDFLCHHYTFRKSVEANL